MTRIFGDSLAFGRPSGAQVTRFWKRAEATHLSYPEVGATLSEPLPPGYTVDHNRVLLGHGGPVYEAAKAALFGWQMFALDWVDLLHPPEPPVPGQTVLILARVFSVTFLSASRIVAMLDERGGVRREGFVYGTLECHAERGEERFSVEHHLEDDSVWYDLLAFSRPQHPLARAAYPFSRRAQRRFARDSKQAMVRSVAAKAP